MITTGVILAGGASARFGGQDKGLITVAGVPIVARVIERLRPQVDSLFIIANRCHTAYAGFGVPVIADDAVNPAAPRFEGPLAGLRTALAHAPEGWVLTVPVDAALLPPDLATRLTTAGAPSYVAGVPVCTLLPTQLRPALEAAWARGERSPKTWLASIGATAVDFAAHPAQFWSMNTPAERDALGAALARVPGQ